VQGIVKSFDSDQGFGIIRGKNGANYPVTLADVIVIKPLQVGQVVYFTVRFVNAHAFATHVGVSRSLQ
jgi:cold shock CspA family protein